MNEDCNQCGGPVEELGTLGSTVWLRCRNCGWEQDGSGKDDSRWEPVFPKCSDVPKPTRHKSSAYVLGATWGWDISEVRECEYQPGHTGKDRIYVVNNDYWAVGQQPPKWGVDGPVPLTWERYGDQFFAEKHGTVVWRAKAPTGQSR